MVNGVPPALVVLYVSAARLSPFRKRLSGTLIEPADVFTGSVAHALFDELLTAACEEVPPVKVTAEASDPSA